MYLKRSNTLFLFEQKILLKERELCYSAIIMSTTSQRSQFKHLPVESEKDEVSLVVEGGDLSTNKLGVLWKEGSEQPADAVAQTCGEVVEDHLWRVFSWIFASSLHREN